MNSWVFILTMSESNYTLRRVCSYNCINPIKDVVKKKNGIILRVNAENGILMSDFYKNGKKIERKEIKILN